MGILSFFTTGTIVTIVSVVVGSIFLFIWGGLIWKFLLKPIFKKTKEARGTKEALDSETEKQGTYPIKVKCRNCGDVTFLNIPRGKYVDAVIGDRPCKSCGLCDLRKIGGKKKDKKKK